MIIVGVDCATTNRKTGLSFAEVSAEGVLTVQKPLIADAEPTPSVAEQIGSKLELERADQVLIALDSPLGWPSTFGKHLAEHLAGRPLKVDRDSFFRRKTDRVVKERVGKAPLEVAANFLARTAVVALQTLEELAQLRHTRIPLAWQVPLTDRIAAIEVYPAGTLCAYQKLMGFVLKRGGTKQCKLDLLEKFRQGGRLRFEPKVFEVVTKNEHALDSVLCLVAGLDFLQGLAVAPDLKDYDQVRKEGWIWVRDPNVPIA